MSPVPPRGSAFRYPGQDEQQIRLAVAAGCSGALGLLQPPGANRRVKGYTHSQARVAAAARLEPWRG
jgi:hypothetical protein